MNAINKAHLLIFLILIPMKSYFYLHVIEIKCIIMSQFIIIILFCHRFMKFRTFCWSLVVPEFLSLFKFEQVCRMPVWQINRINRFYPQNK